MLKLTSFQSANMSSNRKFLLAAFRGDLMCFVHVMLNALDLKKQGYTVEILLEGESTKIPMMYLQNPKLDFFPLWTQILDNKLITAVCRACSKKMAAYDAAIELKLSINGEMSGHPPLSKWLSEGFEIITF